MLLEFLSAECCLVLLSMLGDYLVDFETYIGLGKIVNQSIGHFWCTNLRPYCKTYPNCMIK